MSYIDRTRKSLTSPYQITVCLTKGECEILKPFFEKSHKQVREKLEKYQDIHEGGEATEREENLRLNYSEMHDSLNSVLSSFKEILK